MCAIHTRRIRTGDAEVKDAKIQPGAHPHRCIRFNEPRVGMRQCLGLFLPPMTPDLSLTASDFTVAIAAQNIAWGIAQAPLVHCLTNGA